MRYLIKFSYDGSKFHGFQRQKNVLNVQSEIENAMSLLYNEAILIKGAGRTDSKVHAINQYAHYDADKKLKNIKYKLNKKLKNIKIKKVKKVSNNFHARYSVREKTYLYKLTFNKTKNNNYYAYYYGDLNFKKLQEVSKIFIGTHNFKNFVAGYRDNYNGSVSSIKIYKRNKNIYFIFKGHGFYRYMVRNLVGAIIDVGRGKVEIKDVEEMLINYEKRKQLTTAKAEGLYLKQIKY